jgi:hypothetical protein
MRLLQPYVYRAVTNLLDIFLYTPPQHLPSATILVNVKLAIINILSCKLYALFFIVCSSYFRLESNNFFWHNSHFIH